MPATVLSQAYVTKVAKKLDRLLRKKRLNIQQFACLADWTGTSNVLINGEIRDFVLKGGKSSIPWWANSCGRDNVANF